MCLAWFQFTTDDVVVFVWMFDDGWFVEMSQSSELCAPWFLLRCCVRFPRCILYRNHKECGKCRLCLEYLACPCVGGVMLESCLVVLELDLRYFELVRSVADSMGGDCSLKLWSLIMWGLIGFAERMNVLYPLSWSMEEECWSIQQVPCSMVEVMYWLKRGWWNEGCNGVCCLAVYRVS